MLSDRPPSTSVGMDPSPPPLVISSSELPPSLVPTDTSDEASASSHSTPDFHILPQTSEIYTASHHGPTTFYTGPHDQEPQTGPNNPNLYTGYNTGNDLVGGSSTSSGPTPTGNATNSATGTQPLSNVEARDVHTLYALLQAAETVAVTQPSLSDTQSYGCTTVTPSIPYTRSGYTASRPIQGPYLCKDLDRPCL